MEDNIEKMSYPELQEIAKNNGLKFVGINKTDLRESVRSILSGSGGSGTSTPGTEVPGASTGLSEEEIKAEEEAKAKEEAEAEAKKKAAKAKTKEEEEIKEFRGQNILDVNIKLVNGRSFKEVRVVSGEVFLLTEEEFNAGI